MKRIFGLLLCVLVVALVACSDSVDLPTGGGFAEDQTTGGHSGGTLNVQGTVTTKDTTFVIGR